jgi:hypothetical protein
MHQFSLLGGGNVLVAEEDDATAGDEGGQVAHLVWRAEQGRDLEASGELGADCGRGVVVRVGKQLGLFCGCGEWGGECVHSPRCLGDSGRRGFGGDSDGRGSHCRLVRFVEFWAIWVLEMEKSVVI